MNPKRVRYYLFAAVIAIWGLIIYKVIKGLKSDDPVPPVKKLITKLNYDNSKDSFVLFANYPDPFIKDIPGSEGLDQSEYITTPNSSLINLPTVPQKPSYDFSKIVYTGMIINPETKKKIAFISVAGKEYTVREGEIIDMLKIRKITAYNIVILADGKTASILLKKE